MIVDVHGTLGRLAKWLRILGIDTRFPRKNAVPNIWFITKKTEFPSIWTVEVTENHYLDQLRQVITAIEFEPEFKHLFSRCLICNVQVQPVSGTEQNKTLDFVLPESANLSRCPVCKRLYWRGSHVERVIRRLNERGIYLK